MRIYIEKSNSNIVHDGQLDGMQLLELLKINPDSVILVRNDEVILEDEILSDKDDIKILSVISGG